MNRCTSRRIAVVLWILAAACGPAPLDGDPSGGLASAVTTYQAENAALVRATVASNWSGSSGTGFVDYANEVGSAVEFTVSAPAAGTATVVFRYANGTTQNRTMDVGANGSLAVAGVSFAGTGAWSTWSTQSVSLSLRAGSNTIRATATTANGGPNLDRIDVTTQDVTTTYTLSIEVSGNGTTSPAPGTASYAAGTPVSVTAVPASGATLAGWSGAATGTANPVTVVMNGNQTLTATFTGGGGGSCDAGTTTTAWATSCPTAPPAACVSGTWVDPGSTTGDPAQCQSTHFAVHAPSGTITAAQCQAAIDQLENVIWPAYFGSPIFFPEPYCSSTAKYKASVHVRTEFALTGGGWGSGFMGMWVGPGATADHWGLAHEFMHAVQSTTRGLSCGGSTNSCGWIYESHANFMPHQLPEFANNVHCTEMLANAPHLYLGSTRDRYCNWQFMEYLKDRYCHRAVNDIWNAPTRSNDPFDNIRTTRGWSVSQLNDFLGEWAMHNVTWDYKASGPAFRATYGAITDTSRAERRLRLTQLEPLDGSWASNRRFVSPWLWAPQRWGYNVVRLRPEAGATSVTVTFRGVVQTAASSDWRWGLVATSSTLTNPRYSALQRGSDGQLTFCVAAGESLWLVVMGAPSVQQHVVWDQAYSSIYRYPYMVQLAGAWPEGFQGGARAPCASGLVRVANGGGCGPSSLPSSVYVGPFAQVVGGTVSGTARIEDHATVLSGTVSGGTVGGLTIVNRFTVSPSAKAQTTFYPLGFFESGQAISGSAWLYGDVEFRGQGSNRSSGSCSGFVDSATCVPGTISDVTIPPPYAWR